MAERALLGGAALVFLAVAAQALVVPDVLVEPVRVAMLAPDGYAEIRAGYGGAFGGLAALFAWGARSDAVRPVALRLLAGVTGVFAAARWVSLAVDGVPAAFSLGILALETTTCVAAVALVVRGVRRRS